MLGLAVQGVCYTLYWCVAVATVSMPSRAAELGDYSRATCEAGYLSNVELMPRLVS